MDLVVITNKIINNPLFTKPFYLCVNFGPSYTREPTFPDSNCSDVSQVCTLTLMAGAVFAARSNGRGLENGFSYESKVDDIPGLTATSYTSATFGSPHKKLRTVVLTREVRVPVPQPYPVTVERIVPYPVTVPLQVEVDKPVPVYVDKPVPVHVEREVLYPVEKHVPYPVLVSLNVPVPVPHTVHVPKPYPVHVPKPIPVPQPVYIEKSVPVYVKKGQS